MDTATKQIIINHKKAAALHRFHPWVFSGAILKREEGIEDGDRVHLIDDKGNFLALGHYQDAGSISVRVLSFEQEALDQQFWDRKFQEAFQLRQRLGLTNNSNTNCYRLIHAEGDGMPGLVVDIYGATAVVQCHSAGMAKEKTHIINALTSILGDKLDVIYNKSEQTLPTNKENPASIIENEYWMGHAVSDPVIENGHLFRVNWEIGQKTGFFLDQRDNRQSIAQLCKGKSVLNAFCYTGGFTIYALKAGATSVDSVDISKTAISCLKENIELNFPDGLPPSSASLHVADTLQFLSTCAPYDIVIIDPPAYAKSLKKRHNAVQGYKRLNEKAIKKVNPGGFLATFSCSQVVDATLFYNTVVAAAHEAKRQAKVIGYFHQGADHPVSIFHPESAYLKGLLLYVE